MRAGELYYKDIPEPVWVVSDLLIGGTANLLWGRQGIGKTFLMLDMALSVARGVPFLNRATTGGPVLYYCLEGGERPLRNRLHIYPDETIDWNALPLDFKYNINLDSNEGWSDFIGGLRGRALCVIDPILSVSFPGLKFNDNDMVRELMRRLEQAAAETGCCIVLVHHRRKISHAETQYPNDEVEDQSALGAVSWLALCSTRMQLAADAKTGLKLRLRAYGKEILVQSVPLTKEGPWLRYENPAHTSIEAVSGLEYTSWQCGVCRMTFNPPYTETDYLAHVETHRPVV